MAILKPTIWKEQSASLNFKQEFINKNTVKLGTNQLVTF
jgi:hypothetical protein